MRVETPRNHQRQQSPRNIAFRHGRDPWIILTSSNIYTYYFLHQFHDLILFGMEYFFN